MQIHPLRFGINRCYLVRGNGIIMIDGGPPNKLKAFQKYIHTLNINPRDVSLLVLTHGDFDHVGSAKDIKEFTGAQIAIHENDRRNFEDSLYNFPPGTNSWGKISRFVLNPILKILLKFPGGKTDIILKDSDYSLQEFGINGKIIFSPGHTKGSISVLLETGEAFVGCLAHNNPPFRLKPGLPIYADDIEMVKKSWDSLIQRGAKMIYPAHGDPFHVNIIKNVLSK